MFHALQTAGGRLSLIRVLSLLVLPVSMLGVVLQAADEIGSSESMQTSLSAWERVTDEEAWRLLPALASGEKQPLPNWVKAVAVHMPRTAAAMLKLDTAYRTQGPLEPALRAKLRWIIARANKCPYSEAYALADLRRVSGDDVRLEEFTGDAAHWPEMEADAFEFVRLLTVAAPTIPDALFERVRARHGEHQVAAMVLLAAYGNFQDRILLGLNVPLEKDGPLAPLDAEFAEGALQITPLLPPDNGVATYEKDGRAITPRDPSWTATSYEQLQERLEQQRSRQPRLPVPDWDTVKTKLPKAMAARPTGIRWSLVTYGYAPELAIPWTVTTRTHWAEYPSDRILEESLFWIQTRAIECNYCMGHCEMLLEVAGLDKAAVAKRTRLLADSDWAAFPPREQRAYAFARKLSRAPHEMTASDYQTLEKDFGPKRAMSIFFWLCRGLYMTRVSDGFQLPLERENVFDSHAPTKPASEQNN